MAAPAFLRVTPGGSQTSAGLHVLRLALWTPRTASAAPVERDHTWAVSGQPGRQVFRLAKERWPGSMEPIGEGVYQLGDPDARKRVNWASGRAGDYSGTFGSGLGPAWVGIHALPGNPYGLLSWDLGLHADDNQAWSPGTSGCLGIQEDNPPARDFRRLRQVMSWFEAWDVSRLQVDWGLGTVGKPK